MSYHIFESIAVLKATNDQTHSSLVLTLQLYAAMFDAIIIYYQRLTLNGRYQAKWQSEEVLDSTPANLLQEHVTVYIWLLGIRLEDDLEIGDDY